MSNSHAVRRAALVVNARSRAGQRAFSQAKELLKKLDVPLRATYPLRDPARLPETVQEILDEDHDLLVLGGGDGTVSSVVDYLTGTDAILGVLPMGTANDFARTLGVPSDLDEACRTIAEGKVVDVDLGLAGRNYYVNVASVGLSAAVTHALTPSLKKRLGNLAYPVATAKGYFRHQPFAARLSFPDGEDGPQEHERVLQLAIGNGRFYGGGMVVAPGAGIDDRALDIYTLRSDGYRNLLDAARYLKSGNFTRIRGLTHGRASRVYLETDPPLPINIDGELVATTPQTFSVAHNALHVLIPQDSTAAQLD